MLITDPTAAAAAAIRSSHAVSVLPFPSQVYAEKLLSMVDPGSKLIEHKLYRDSCLNVDGNFLKVCLGEMGGRCGARVSELCASSVFLRPSRRGLLITAMDIGLFASYCTTPTHPLTYFLVR